MDFYYLEALTSREHPNSKLVNNVIPLLHIEQGFFETAIQFTNND